MALCLCDASKKQAKETALDMEAAAEKMIFFEEATGVYTEKVYESLQETQVSSYKVDTAPACDCSHAQPWH